ncbi:hypothetical protein MXAN_5685 [Myxococcus xanthus DK 1622]|uniref:Uncharacterized protein n=1 Tax=Myxococcus xanthus (strain DK1622) TaxID=246197 RepID=Q1D0K0_MYXXD|nr:MULTISPECIES: hypothetical protein [Myxococcus]ABF89009.1 hypothetical protein MXAN_5685 [Myxococcus xanthus DK 1622]NOJ56257.1 hypothetical protein [Myxococcus xanthus]QPM78105.1 hypothetical protein I5Q59_28060 [Myxococcus xanthus]QQR42972.1 hypothetical protein JKA73_28540 [Myxococcus xanthus]QVW67172.1 hypothetical protein JTM82_33410 [Myxococcus xanthus DZ2]
MIAQLLAATLALTSSQAPVSVSGRGSPQVNLPFPSGDVQTYNIIQWDPNQLPRIYERSDQLPLTDEELTKLSQAGFEPAQLVKMIEERRCACDASADGLIRLKKAGVDKDVLAAVSRHGLAPNRGLNLLVTLDFTGESRNAREAFLYFFVDDGDITRVFTANIPELLRRRNSHETTVDRSDILVARTVRRVQLAGQVPLRTYGKHNVLVVASASPTLTHPSQLTAQELSRSQRYTFDYPRASLQNVCRLTAGYRRDAVLAYKWNFEGSRFECEWN